MFECIGDKKIWWKIIFNLSKFSGSRAKLKLRNNFNRDSDRFPSQEVESFQIDVLVRREKRKNKKFQQLENRGLVWVLERKLKTDVGNHGNGRGTEDFTDNRRWVLRCWVRRWDEISLYFRLWTSCHLSRDIKRNCSMIFY